MKKATSKEKTVTNVPTAIFNDYLCSRAREIGQLKIDYFKLKLLLDTGASLAGLKNTAQDCSLNEI